MSEEASCTVATTTATNAQTVVTHPSATATDALVPAPFSFSVADLLHVKPTPGLGHSRCMLIAIVFKRQ
jgi:hypothetical protein